MRCERFIVAVAAGLAAAVAVVTGAEAYGVIRREATVVADVTIAPSCAQASPVCGLTPRAARHR